MINNRSVIIPLVILFSIQGVIASVMFFQNKSEEISQLLTMETGKVAGTSTGAIIDLTQELPLIPNADISNVDTSNGKVSVTLESKLPEDEVRTYYEDYMLINGWNEVEESVYVKGNRKMEIGIADTVVTINLITL